MLPAPPRFLHHAVLVAVLAGAGGQCTTTGGGAGPGVAPTSSSGPAPAPVPDHAAPDRNAVPIRPLFDTQLSCAGEQRDEAVIRTKDEWDAWKIATCASRGKLTGDEPDFAKETVLAVRDGWAPDTCCLIRIASIADAGTELVVHVTDRDPQRRALCGQAIVHPASAVAVARSEKPVRFDWSDTVRSRAHAP